MAASPGTDIWVGVAVEITPGEPRMGGIRLAHNPDRKAKSVVGFVRENVGPMSDLPPGIWASYSG